MDPPNIFKRRQSCILLSSTSGRHDFVILALCTNDIFDMAKKPNKFRFYFIPRWAMMTVVVVGVCILGSGHISAAKEETRSNVV